ncbi:SMODS domain-containing nucleotidyltransferase [Streptomyces longwoodensis]|uniref:SMODS domain-containing nucleotidyltransferase n=1 Tax=Streptomyces longwoodensis TaxID=68231 RepID=UPI000A717FD3|nr:hypothetical protein [Streptomyces longwoodensis]
MNATLERSFELFTQRISLNKQEVSEALERATEICRFLRQATQIQSCKITGSMAHSTAIRKYSDVDVAAVLYPLSLTENTPQSITAGLLTLLTRRYHTAAISENTVRISFTKGPDVDVIPAIPASNKATYTIPSPDRKAWHTYDPERRNKEITEKTAQLGVGFIRLIRIAKWWSGCNGQPLASYEIEDAASAAFTFPMPPTSFAIVDFFEHVRHLPKKLYDDQDATISSARAIAEKALESEQQGDTQRALYYWGSLLGDQFPNFVP